MQSEVAEERALSRRGFVVNNEGSALSWKKKESPPLFFARWSSLRLLRVGALCGARRPRARDRLRATACAKTCLFCAPLPRPPHALPLPPSAPMPAADNRHPDDANEPLLKANPNRFVIFPIKYPQLWEMYKKVRRLPLLLAWFAPFGSPLPPFVPRQKPASGRPRSSTWRTTSTIGPSSPTTSAIF